MAQKISLVDDIDGTPITAGNGGNIQFSVNGSTYSIDLSGENIARLNDALAPFVSNARKVTAAGTKARRVQGPRNSDVAAIREWARENGVEVSERGRISASVREAYEARH